MKLMRKNTDYFPTVFDDMFGKDWFNAKNGMNTLPAVNIRENEDAFTVEMAAPGMSKKDFNVQVEKDVLTISYDHKEEKNDQENGFTRKEFSYNSFKRSFVLPEYSDVDKISASYKDGILSLSIPKKEEAKNKAPRAIKIA